MRLLELTDDPGMQDMPKFLIARDTMHQQQWLAVLGELQAEGANTFNAPGDYENEPEYEKYAYAFFNHLADGEAANQGRWTTGPSPDGLREFHALDPAPGIGPDPGLQKAPPEVDAGLEATGPVAASVFGKVGENVKQVADKVTPG